MELGEFLGLLIGLAIFGLWIAMFVYMIMMASAHNWQAFVGFLAAWICATGWGITAGVAAR